MAGLSGRCWRRPWRRASLLAAVVALAATGCDGDSPSPDGGAAWDLSGRCGAPRRVAFVTSDFSTGSAGFFSLNDWTSHPDLMTIHADAVVRCACGAVVVIERLGGDDLTVLSARSMSLIGQHSLGARSNPYDAWIDGELAYVTLFGRGEVVAVNLVSGEILKRLDLSGHADDDGNPEVAMIHQDDGRLYVTLQRLDRRADLWQPTGPGVVVVLSIEPLEEVASFTLEGVNPVTDLVPGAEDGVVWVGHAGDWAVDGDGGIERIELAARASELVVDGDALGGNVIDLAIADADTGYVTVNEPGVEDRLVLFDPSTGDVGPALYRSTPYSLVDVELDLESGRLLVADRNLTAPGVLVFDAADGSPILDEPVETHLPPFDMCLLPEPVPEA